MPWKSARRCSSRRAASCSRRSAATRRRRRPSARSRRPRPRRTSGCVGEAEVVVRAEQQDVAAVEAAPAAPAPTRRSASAGRARRRGSPRAAPRRSGPSAGRWSGSYGGVPVGSWGRPGACASWRSRGAGVEGSQRSASSWVSIRSSTGVARAVALEPAAAVVGPRVRAVVGLAGDVEAEVGEHLPVIGRLGAEGGQEVAHHHPVEAGLDGERLQLVQVLDPAAAEPEEGVGEDQAEDRDPLDDLPRDPSAAGRRTSSRSAG